MKKLILLLYVFYLPGCANSQESASTKFAETITQKDLKEYLSTISDDSFEGREAGKIGQKKAANYIVNKFREFDLLPGVIEIGEKSYFQKFIMHKDGRRRMSDYPLFLNKTDIDLEDKKFEDYIETENIVGIIEGSEKKDEFIIISAHYDHIGENWKGIFNGADDNGSGTSAILEIAQAFHIAKEQNYQPKRSIIFLAFTAEEKGLIGSRYYVKNPTINLENVVANINIDMIGRNGEDFIYVIGASIETPKLENIIEDVNEKYVDLYLDYSQDSGQTPSSIYKRSDQYNFSRKGIPAVFFYTGHHSDYHQTTDTYDKINFNGLEKRTKLIFHTAWELANQEENIRKKEKE